MKKDSVIDSVDRIADELREGMQLAKCRKCGCMKETFESLENSLHGTGRPDDDALLESIEGLKSEMEPIRYACLGCAYCFPAVAMNMFSQAYPDAVTEGLACAIEENEKVWPPVVGEYKVLCDHDDCPVAISTLGSVELADRIAAEHPKEVCIVGKTETENIGIDKIIKNTITNPTIRYLVLAGSDPVGHLPGQTIVSLSAKGVDERMRVIGSNGKRPILRNVTTLEVEAFREQVEVIDMIGCENIENIMQKIRELPMTQKSSGTRAEEQPTASHACGCAECSEAGAIAEITDVPTIQATEPKKIQIDKAGYFVVLPQEGKRTILVEHYDYGDKLLRRIEGKDARSIYWTIVENNWVSQLSHSAYLGKELTKAELSLKHGFKYVQDGA